jgi:hydrogenase maturation protein HypF
MEGVITRRIRVYGIVQGVGFRPTVSRHAMENKITGTVANCGPYVEIYAQGSHKDVDNFCVDIEHRPPKRAVILKVDQMDVEDEKLFSGFSIIESEKTSGEIFISPDIAICEDCKRELYDPKDRRYLHPFINCTSCGPRLTILDALPYDRERTSMKIFPMCPECAEEYRNSSTRRYDAQPVCCNDCGPEVYLLGRHEKGREAIIEARRIIRRGGIVAIKGIGGFHLCCDAANEEAVNLLRQRKKRPMKPFAVMMQNEEVVKRECSLEPWQEDILTGHQKPILLLERKENGSLCEAVAPDNPRIGVMLPYAPIQLLLFDYDDGEKMPECLVMTSGNISGAPICRDDAEAEKELGHLADCILSHNRKIRIRSDDSVMDSFRGKPYVVRRSRGYAPLPVVLTKDYNGTVLAMGGELKNSFCISVNNLNYLSPYVGDLQDLRTVQALKETIGRFETLLEAEPEVVVCDLHPSYNSVALAKEMKLPLIQVQHHYAHILSCMAENDCHHPVIGASFDGTGYGEDGTIWGGEILICDENGFERAGSIKPFIQIGGDASAREGWRIAVSMLSSLIEDQNEALKIIRELNLCDEQTAKVMLAMKKRKVNAVFSTSAGRLFDGVSALLGIRKASTFEGEASTALQYRAEKWMAENENTGEVCAEEPDRDEAGFVILKTDDLVKWIIRERIKGENPDYLAYVFHCRLAAQIAGAVIETKKKTGIHTAAFSGGVFQNKLLLEMTVKLLEENNMEVLIHHLIPPNDGGIALGQAVYGMQQLQKRKKGE